MRRRRHIADTRPKWDDPDLQGPLNNDERQWLSAAIVDAEHPIQLIFDNNQTIVIPCTPRWKDDPTYNMRKKR